MTNAKRPYRTVAAFLGEVEAVALLMAVIAVLRLKVRNDL
jgi:hypothetical protein